MKITEKQKILLKNYAELKKEGNKASLAKAENELIKVCLPFVKNIARKYQSHKEYEDLLSSGNEGLFFAIRNFSEEKIDTFFKYLIIKIEGAMKDYLRDIDEMSRNRRDSFKKHQKTFEELSVTLSRSPLETEMAQALEMTLSEYQSFKSSNQSPQNVSQIKTNDGESEALIDYLSEDKESFLVQKEQLIQDHQIQDIINQHVNFSDEKTKLIFSLQHNAHLNLKEIAKILNVSECRVSQINSKNIKNLISSLFEDQKLRNNFLND